jgi:hypothetical protein
MLLPPYTVSVSDGTELTDPATNFFIRTAAAWSTIYLERTLTSNITFGV